MCYGKECQFYLIDELNEKERCLNEENCYSFNKNSNGFFFNKEDLISEKNMIGDKYYEY